MSLAPFPLQRLCRVMSPDPPQDLRHCYNERSMIFKRYSLRLTPEKFFHRFLPTERGLSLLLSIALPRPFSVSLPSEFGSSLNLRTFPESDIPLLHDRRPETGDLALFTEVHSTRRPLQPSGLAHQATRHYSKR
jgi:hypothetical protein